MKLKTARSIRKLPAFLLDPVYIIKLKYEGSISIATLEELEAKVTHLENIQAIEDLQRMYGYYFDTHNWKKIVDLFSDNTESIEIADHGIFYGKKSVKKTVLGCNSLRK